MTRLSLASIGPNTKADDVSRTWRAACSAIARNSDSRAARFAELVSASPEAPLATVLRRSGASRRTIERIFHAETSMSLGQWLRRQKLLHALRRLAAGETVNSIALELGYNSPSAFIAMFRRELGQTPARYFET